VKTAQESVVAFAERLRSEHTPPLVGSAFRNRGRRDYASIFRKVKTYHP
jgi:hypothetical protein